jgi:hypothetical protein
MMVTGAAELAGPAANADMEGKKQNPTHLHPG